MDPDELNERQAIARALLSAGSAPTDRGRHAGVGALAAIAPRPIHPGLMLALPFPAGLQPRPQLPSPRPAADDPLPAADVVIVTWTADEADALSDVLTPGIGRQRWLRYTRGYDALLPRIRVGAPARAARRLGSYCLSQIRGQRVLCFKSELHLNQDGVTAPPFSPRLASLPVKDLLHQILEETGARLVITTGTAGATYAQHELGDVVVTRAAKFRLQGEFRDAPWNGQIYRSEWEVPTSHLAQATALMKGHQAQLKEPEFLPPTVNYTPLTAPRPVRKAACDIKLDGIAFPAFHPMLTTDFFEFGTSTNHLETQVAPSRWETPCWAWRWPSALLQVGRCPTGWWCATARTRRSTARCVTAPRRRTCRPCGRCTTTAASVTGLRSTVPWPAGRWWPASDPRGRNSRHNPQPS